MELVIKEGQTVCRDSLPKTHEIIDSQIIMNGRTYTDFAEITLDSIRRPTIVNYLKADLVIICKEKTGLINSVKRIFAK